MLERSLAVFSDSSIGCPDQQAKSAVDIFAALHICEIQQLQNPNVGPINKEDLFGGTTFGVLL